MLRLTPGGLRSGRPPLQPRVRLEERGLQRGDLSLWLRPARRDDAGEYHATVTLRGRAGAARPKDHALSCRLRLRVGQASSRWGRHAGRRAGRGTPGRPAAGRQEGLGRAALLRVHPRPTPERPQKGGGRGWEAGWHCTAV